MRRFSPSVRRTLVSSASAGPDLIASPDAQMAKKCRRRCFAHECHVIRRSIPPVTQPVLTALGRTGAAPRRRSFTQSHAGGVVVRSDGGMPRYFLVCARRGPAQWIVPRVTSSRGRRARRRQGAARCGGRRPACAPEPWCPSPTGSRPSVRRTRLYDTERTRFRHRRRRGRGSRVRSKADGPPTARSRRAHNPARAGTPGTDEEPAEVRLCCRPQNGARTLDRSQAHRDHRPTQST